MARSRLLFIVATLCAQTGTALSEEPRPDVATWKEDQAEKAAAEEAKVKTEKKKSAIDKAVTLLEGLRSKVAAEGEAEAKTYNEFACFCKETTKEKLESITKGEDSKEQLTADISELSSKRENLDSAVQAAEEAIALCRKDMEGATAQRKEGSALYQTNNEDLTGAISALESALQRLKASKNPLPPPSKDESFLQSNNHNKESSSSSSNSNKDLAEALRSPDLLAAVQLADALGLSSDKEGFASFLAQAPEVQMEDYKFKSDGIITMLEKLLDQFRDEKVETDKAEVESVSTYDKFMQQKKDEVKAKEHEIEVAKASKAEAEASIGALSKELTTVEATLKDDKQYASELSDLCRDKAKTWDQRSTLRSSELYTLTQALSVIKGTIDSTVSANTIRFAETGATLQQVKALARDPEAMEAIEAAAEAAPSLVQIRRVLLSSATKSLEPAQGRNAVVKLLKEQGSKLKSTLLTELAAKLASNADPFAKVKQLIQELIERLMQQATNEANQKGWCDKSIQAARQKRDYAAEEVRSLNSKMAQLEARRDHLADELSLLETSIAEIKAAQSKAEQERADEKDQNEATISEAQEGLEALNMVVELLDHFYKASAKEKVSLSLLSQPKVDAPDAGFDVGEAYTGAQSESGGILAMLDVMKSDFIRTVSETQVAEQKAQEEHLEFMTESGKSLAQKEEAETERRAQHQDVLGKLSEATESFSSHNSIVLTAIKELLELKPVCIDTGMSYEDRVSNREEEIAALNRAVCILEQYQEYGPDATSGSC